MLVLCLHTITKRSWRTFDLRATLIYIVKGSTYKSFPTKRFPWAIWLKPTPFFYFPQKIGIFLSKAQVIFFSSYKVSSTNRICIPDSKPVNKIWKHYIFVWSTNERIPLKWFRPSQNYGFTSSNIVTRFKVTKHRLECN